MASYFTKAKANPLCPSAQKTFDVFSILTRRTKPKLPSSHLLSQIDLPMLRFCFSVNCVNCARSHSYSGTMVGHLISYPPIHTLPLLVLWSFFGRPLPCRPEKTSRLVIPSFTHSVDSPNPFTLRTYWVLKKHNQVQKNKNSHLLRISFFLLVNLAHFLQNSQSSPFLQSPPSCRSEIQPLNRFHKGGEKQSQCIP